MGRQRTEKASERVARQLLQIIDQRGLTAGSMLPSESALLERLEVGKSSLREALRFLEINGVLHVKAGPTGGPIVATPGSYELGQMSALHLGAQGVTFRELLHARVSIEPLLAGLAARRLGDAAEVVRSAQDRGVAVRDADHATFEPVAGGYHDAVFAAAGSPVLSGVAAAYREIWMSRVTTTAFPRTEHDAIIAEHDAITSAITSHDEALSVRLMREHLETYAAYCEKWYPARLDDVVDWK